MIYFDSRKKTITIVRSKASKTYSLSSEEKTILLESIILDSSEILGLVSGIASDESFVSFTLSLDVVVVSSVCGCSLTDGTAFNPMKFRISAHAVILPS
ncbi:hypothetical protein, partial [Enterococcus casseliflavus]|uniref:hypothetical protein n=1 Tax=Enterococcus casseliflavus TaxID=37734 RepID=UPI0022E71408